MSTSDPLMPASEDGRTPKVYQVDNDNVESGKAAFNKNSEAVALEPSSRLIGLTKEQLEDYRNDPFWKPVRLILFVLFWVAWIVMFAGAIFIVVLSPKCAEKQKPEWYQTKVSYNFLVPTFYDSDGDGVGDFKGAREKLDYLRKIGVTTVYPTPVIQTKKEDFTNPYAVVNHRAVDPRFGTEEDFKAFVEEAHDKNMYVVMDLPVSTVSTDHPWYKESAGKSEDPRFIFAKVGSTAKNFYPFHGSTSKKYLGYPDAQSVVLNWKDQRVQDEILEAVKKFLILGVDGFHIDHISQLAVNDDGTPNHDGAVTALGILTTKIRAFVADHDDLNGKQIALFSSLAGIDELHTKRYKASHQKQKGHKVKETGNLTYTIDTSFATLNQSNCKEQGGVARCVHNALQKAHDRVEQTGYTPYWQFSNANSPRLASRFDANTSTLLTFVQLTLPGALSLYYGQELGLPDAPMQNGQRNLMRWDEDNETHHGFVAPGKTIQGSLFFPESSAGDSEDNFEAQYSKEKSPLKVYRALAKLRGRDEAMIVGATIREQLQGDTIIFSRYVAGENNTATGSAFVVAANFGDSPSLVDFTKLSAGIVPSNKALGKAEVAATTAGVNSYVARQKLDLSTETITVPGKQGIVIKL